jgi:hypothetical protein
MTERKSADLPAGKGARVLVVEDGWQVADSLKLLLEQIGMIAVGPAATSEDARRLAPNAISNWQSSMSISKARWPMNSWSGYTIEALLSS